MPATYIVLFLFGAFVVLFPVLSFLVFSRLRQSTPGAPDGVERPGGYTEREGVAPRRYSSRFFLVAAVFTVFSAAVVFLVPWVVGFRVWLDANLAVSSLAALAIFLGILTIGYAWLYKKGGLDWD
jgi:NADH-quinone oxidoreductase subunit A